MAPPCLALNRVVAQRTFSYTIERGILLINLILGRNLFRLIMTLSRYRINMNIWSSRIAIILYAMRTLFTIISLGSFASLTAFDPIPCETKSMSLLCLILMRFYSVYLHSILSCLFCTLVIGKYVALDISGGEVFIVASVSACEIWICSSIPALKSIALSHSVDIASGSYRSELGLI